MKNAPITIAIAPHILASVTSSILTLGVLGVSNPPQNMEANQVRIDISIRYLIHPIETKKTG
jgi:hypothetical protein